MGGAVSAEPNYTAQRDHVRRAYSKLPLAYRWSYGVYTMGDWVELMDFHEPRLISNDLESGQALPLEEPRAGWTPIGARTAVADGAQPQELLFWFDGFGRGNRLTGTGASSYYRKDSNGIPYFAVSLISPDAFKDPEYTEAATGMGYVRWEALVYECMLVPVVMGPYDEEENVFVFHVNRSGREKTLERVSPARLMTLAITAGHYPSDKHHALQEAGVKFGTPTATEKHEAAVLLAEYIYAARNARQKPAFGTKLKQIAFDRLPDLAPYVKGRFTLIHLLNSAYPQGIHAKYGYIGSLQYMTFRDARQYEVTIKDLFNGDFLSK